MDHSTKESVSQSEWKVNDKLETMRKEVIVAYVKVLCRHLRIETEENHENLSQDSRSPDRDLLPQYEAGVLTTRPQSSVTVCGVGIPFSF
jgi:hypothetical protein